MSKRLSAEGMISVGLAVRQVNWYYRWIRNISPQRGRERMDAAAHRLVVQALMCTLSNCVEWISDKEANHVRTDPANQGLRAGEIIRFLREYVRVSGPSCVEQIREQREGWRDRRDYWYRVIVPIDGFRYGLFVELELLDDDPDVPVVVLVNAHPCTS